MKDVFSEYVADLVKENKISQIESGMLNQLRNGNSNIRIYSVRIDPIFETICIDVEVPLMIPGCILLKGIEISLSKDDQLIEVVDVNDIDYEIDDWKCRAHFDSMIHEQVMEIPGLVQLMKEFRKSKNKSQPKI